LHREEVIIMNDQRNVQKMVLAWIILIALLAVTGFVCGSSGTEGAADTKKYTIKFTQVVSDGAGGDTVVCYHTFHCDKKPQKYFHFTKQGGGSKVVLKSCDAGEKFEFPSHQVRDLEVIVNR